MFILSFSSLQSGSRATVTIKSLLKWNHVNIGRYDFVGQTTKLQYFFFTALNNTKKSFFVAKSWSHKLITRKVQSTEFILVT